jgi:hypothetical protein
MVTSRRALSCVFSHQDTCISVGRSVDMATGGTMKSLGVIRRSVGDVSLLRSCRPVLGPIQLHSQWELRALSPSQWSEGYMKAWSYTTTPPYVFMTWFLMKHTDITSFCLVFTSAISVINTMNNKSIFVEQTLTTCRY